MPASDVRRPLFSRILRPRAAVLLTASALVFSAAGCGSLMTTAAINKFQDNLESGDIQGIATSTTQRFRSAAVPDKAALATFDLLGVPVGEVTIDEVKETSPTSQDVFVSVEGSNQKLTYHLSKEADSLGRNRWLVDEITIRQGSGSKEVEKTVTEQMTLLLGVRDVVRTWQSADPDTLPNYASPSLAAKIEQVPTDWRTQLARNYFGEVMNSKPRARMIDGEAEVTLSHKQGQLRLILEEANDQSDPGSASGGRGWVVKTAVIVGRGKEITRELRRECELVASTADFVRAYEAADRNKLQKLTTKALYDDVLSVADLNTHQMSAAKVFAQPFDTRFSSVSNELTVNIDGVETHFTLVDAESNRSTDLRVDEVASFRDGQAVHLSAKLMVVPTVRMFSEALNVGDTARLRYMTAGDWAPTIWDRFQEGRQNVLTSIALPDFDANPSDPNQMPIIRYDGSSVEVRQVTGEFVVSYRLSTSGRRLVVDDVELINLNGVTRLRARLAALCTMDMMADGIVMGDVDSIERSSSPELNRLVWAITAPEELPPTLDLVPILKGQVHTLDAGPDSAIVTIASDYPYARIHLSGDGTRIDDVAFIDRHGNETGRFTQLVRKHRIRTAAK